ncbi:unnamed protein product, partial [Prorocentrum cordatum]
AILAPKTPLPAAASVRCCRQKGSWQQAGVPMAARTASSLELGLPEEDGAESPVPRSLLKEFEAVSDYPGQPDAEPLVPRRRLRGLRALSGRGCSAVAAALAAVGLLAAAAAASPWRGAEPKGPRGAPAGSLVLQGKQEQHSQDGCGDAAAGDGCFEHVAWAREHGILQHPEWYPGLTPSSPASSFQRVLFRQGMGGCRRPCGDAAGPRHASARGRHESGAPGGSSAGPSSSKVDGHLRSSARAAGSSKKKALEASKQRRGSRPKPGPQETQAARRGPRPEEGDAAPERSAADAPAAAAESREQPERSGAEERRRATGAAGVQKDCHDAAPGEQCYGQIQWAMQTGVASNPEWYPGLNASSAFQDFQAFFSSEGRDGCREPCATGHWHGLPADSAAAKSRREKPVSSDVQAQIAAGLNGGPELFCWMLFKAHSYESGLVQLQLTNGYNIFACDAYALFTDFPTRLSDGTETTALGAIESPPSAWGSVLNTEPFVKAWNVIVEDGSFRDYDWTVKADADAVFFPERLRLSLANVPKRKPYWVQNSIGNTPLLGPLEVFSREAIELYAEKGKSCNRPDVVLATGEDGFISMCMQEIGAEAWMDLSQLLSTTIVPECGATWHVVYHPFKDVGSYMACEFATDGHQYQK